MINPAIFTARVSYTMMSASAQAAFCYIAEHRHNVTRQQVEAQFTQEAVEELEALAMIDERNGYLCMHDVLRENWRVISGTR